MSKAAGESTQSLRKSAARRASLLPGAGYARLGHAALGALGLAVLLAFLGSIVLFAINPGPATIWLIPAMLVILAVFSMIESGAVRKMGAAKGGPTGPLGAMFPLLCLVSYALAAGAVVFFLMNIGLTRIGGEAMSPTVQDGEVLIYQKKVDPSRIAPGRIVMARLSEGTGKGKAGDVVICRILAGPGDKIAAKEAHYLVNDKQSSRVGDTGDAEPVLPIPWEKTLTVPADCYFVVQDGPEGVDSQVFNWIRKGNIVSTKVLLCGGRGVGKDLE
jgi:signal peptidase I